MSCPMLLNAIQCCPSQPINILAYPCGQQPEQPRRGSCAKKPSCTPCGGKSRSKAPRRPKRYPMRNFGFGTPRPRPDTKIYRNGEHLCLSYAGHIPGEMYIHGRNLPTTSTFSKRRLYTYTPYEFVDPDGCCRMCNRY